MINTSFTSKLFALDGPVIAGSDLYLSTLNILDLFVRELDLSAGYDLHTLKTRIGNATYTGLHGFKTKVIGGGNTIYFDTATYPDNYFYQSCDLQDVALAGNSAISSGVTLIGDVVNSGVMINASGPTGNVITSKGNFHNNGVVNSSLNFVFHGDLMKNGVMSYSSAKFVGTEDQNVIMLDEGALPGPVIFDSSFPTAPSSYQWVEGGFDLENESAEFLTFSSGLGTVEAVYHCEGNYGETDSLSRRVFVGTELPPPNYPPLAFNLISPDDGDEAGQPVSTGLYLTRIRAGSYTKTIKMLYLK